jgi:hypothetical protein
LCILSLRTGHRANNTWQNKKKRTHIRYLLFTAHRLSTFSQSQSSLTLVGCGSVKYTSHVPCVRRSAPHDLDPNPNTKSYSGCPGYITCRLPPARRCKLSVSLITSAGAGTDRIRRHSLRGPDPPSSPPGHGTLVELGALVGRVNKAALLRGGDHAGPEYSRRWSWQLWRCT